MHSFRMTLAECEQLSAGLYPGFAVFVSTTAMFRFVISCIEVVDKGSKGFGHHGPLRRCTCSFPFDRCNIQA